MDGLFRYLESTSKDFSNETACLGSGRDENFKLALFDFGHTFDFLIATDGIADELQTEKIETLHDYFKSKFQNTEASRRNDALKCDLEEFLNEKNNDDKSMIFKYTLTNSVSINLFCSTLFILIVSPSIRWLSYKACSF